MPLPSSGQISMSQVNVELGKSATAQISLNDSDVRALAEKPTGQISMSDLWGKSVTPEIIAIWNNTFFSSSANFFQLPVITFDFLFTGILQIAVSGQSATNYTYAPNGVTTGQYQILVNWVAQDTASGTGFTSNNTYVNLTNNYNITVTGQGSMVSGEVYESVVRIAIRRSSDSVVVADANTTIQLLRGF